MDTNVTHDMLAAKIDELRSSVSQLHGHELHRAYGIISSIATKPYQFHIRGPVQILPDWTHDDWNAGVVGPTAVPPSGVPVPTIPGEIDPVPIIAVPGHSAGTTIRCPNCNHALKLNLTL